MQVFSTGWRRYHIKKAFLRCIAGTANRDTPSTCSVHFKYTFVPIPTRYARLIRDIVVNAIVRVRGRCGPQVGRHHDGHRSLYCHRFCGIRVLEGTCAGRVRAVFVFTSNKRIPYLHASDSSLPLSRNFTQLPRSVAPMPYYFLYNFVCFHTATMAILQHGPFSCAAVLLERSGKHVCFSLSLSVSVCLSLSLYHCLEEKSHIRPRHRRMPSFVWRLSYRENNMRF